MTYILDVVLASQRFETIVKVFHYTRVLYSNNAIPR